jgi:hypothetical protein
MAVILKLANWGQLIVVNPGKQTLVLKVKSGGNVFSNLLFSSLLG